MTQPTFWVVLGRPAPRGVLARLSRPPREDAATHSFLKYLLDTDVSDVGRSVANEPTGLGLAGAGRVRCDSAVTLELDRSWKSRGREGAGRGAGRGRGMSCGNSMCRREELWHSLELPADRCSAEIHLPGRIFQTQAGPCGLTSRAPGTPPFSPLLWRGGFGGGLAREVTLRRRGSADPTEPWQGARGLQKLISHLDASSNWLQGLSRTRQCVLDSVFFSVKWGWKSPPPWQTPGAFASSGQCCRNLMFCGFC